MVSGTRRLLMVSTVAIVTAVGFLTASLATATMGPDYSPPPGVLNPAVTQANIYQIICVRGWTKTIRPPLSYTEHLKREQIRERHLPGRLGDYEEDHFIPLELGGDPRDPRNLWPQPWSQAKRKDQWEISLNRVVCASRMSLADAQRKIADPQLWW